MSWKTSERLMDTIRHYASFPATGVSLRQMVQFGEKPSTGAWSFASLLSCFPASCFPLPAARCPLPASRSPAPSSQLRFPRPPR
jgi:hypothetical protein